MFIFLYLITEMRVSFLLVKLIFIKIALGNLVQQKRNILERILRNYDSSVRPFILSDSPTRISVNLFILDLFDVNEHKMEYVIQLYLREIWDDPRLRYPDTDGTVQSLLLTNPARVWTPDLFFNEREGAFHQIQKSNRYIKIYPTGKVAYNSRLTLKMHCPMNFKYFPFDRQICTFDLESYGMATNEISLKWVDGNAIQVSSRLHISNYILEDFSFGYCDKLTKHGHGCLSTRLHLKRQHGFFLSQIFIPLVILVAVSWLSLWLDPRAVYLRLPLVLVVLFIIFMLVLEAQRVAPKTAYTKAIDVWMAVCLALVFAALLQFLLVNQLCRREKRIEMLKVKNGRSKQKIANATCASHKIPLSKRIDFVCRVAFPIAFVIFNCVFWFYYIKRREDRPTIK